MKDEAVSAVGSPSQACWTKKKYHSVASGDIKQLKSYKTFPCLCLDTIVPSAVLVPTLTLSAAVNLSVCCHWKWRKKFSPKFPPVSVPLWFVGFSAEDVPSPQINQEAEWEKGNLYTRSNTVIHPSGYVRHSETAKCLFNTTTCYELLGHHQGWHM